MKALRAGAIYVGYENGFLRRIRYGDSEILRMIYFALRDHNWNTVMSTFENEVIEADDSSFSIRYDCLHHEGGVTVMAWKASIKGYPDGTIEFEISGKVLEDFRRNRAGFCVLHPLRAAGSDCVITHPGGQKEILRFPIMVAPDNPFKDIAGMEWTSAGITFRLSFEGDVFETEDQRNWSDASYKTFCTPLDQPFPVQLKRGDAVFQRVTFKPARTLAPARVSASYVTLEEDGTSTLFPFFGLAASTETAAMNAEAVAAIRALNMRHYRIEVSPADEDWVTTFSAACELGFELGAPLEVALHLTDNYREEIEAFVVLCLQNKVRLRKILLLNAQGLVTTPGMVDKIPEIKQNLPRVLVGVGTNFNFNEINKNRFSPGNADYFSFSIDPQEHAFDDLTVLENIEAQEHLVKSVRAIYGESMPVHVSPLTLRKRFNPYATSAEGFTIPEALKADPRQQETFAAVWTFGSLCNLAKGGASAVTLFQTVGRQGILSVEGRAYPVYEVLKNFSSWAGRTVTIPQSTDSLSVQGIVLPGKMLALVNYADEPKGARYGGAEYTLAARETRFAPLNRA